MGAECVEDVQIFAAYVHLNEAMRPIIIGTLNLFMTACAGFGDFCDWGRGH